MKSGRKNLITLIGDSRIGKTAIFESLQNHPFVETYVPTSGVRHFTYTNPSIENPDITELNIWDTSGDPALRDIVSLYSRRIDIAVIVTDELSTATIAALNQWFDLVRTANAAESPPHFVIVRTKSDTTGKSPSELKEEVERQKKCAVLEISSKTGEGMEEFVNLLYQICQERKLNPPPRATPGPSVAEGIDCKCNVM
jgi:small GTP-binding protein